MQLKFSLMTSNEVAIAAPFMHLGLIMLSKCQQTRSVTVFFHSEMYWKPIKWIKLNVYYVGAGIKNEPKTYWQWRSNSGGTCFICDAPCRILSGCKTFDVGWVVAPTVTSSAVRTNRGWSTCRFIIRRSNVYMISSASWSPIVFYCDSLWGKQFKS